MGIGTGKKRKVNVKQASKKKPKGGKTVSEETLSETNVEDMSTEVVIRTVSEGKNKDTEIESEDSEKLDYID